MGGLVGGGGSSDGGAKDAAQAQVKSQQAAIDFYKQVYNNQLQLQAPQRAVGNQALQALAGLWGFNPGVDPYPVPGIGGATGTFSNTPSTGGSSGGSRGLNKTQIHGGLSLGDPWANGGSAADTETINGHFRDWNKHCAKHPNDPACALHAAIKAGGNQNTGTPFPPSTPANALLPTAGANPLLTFLQRDPGYQFRLQQGQQALDRQLNAQGLHYSGAQLKGINRYNQDYATNEFSNAYNRLAGLAGYQQTANQNISNSAGQLGQNVGQSLQNIGDARASGYINAGQAKQNGFNNLLNTVGTAASVYAAFGSSKELKTIHGEAQETLDAVETLPIYEWTYKPGIGDQKRHVGPTAEDWAERFGGDGKEISVIDVLGVLLKSVQQISRRLDALEAA